MQIWFSEVAATALCSTSSFDYTYILIYVRIYIYSCTYILVCVCDYHMCIVCVRAIIIQILLIYINSQSYFFLSFFLRKIRRLMYMYSCINKLVIVNVCHVCYNTAYTRYQTVHSQPHSVSVECIWNGRSRIADKTDVFLSHCFIARSNKKMKCLHALFP